MDSAQKLENFKQDLKLLLEKYDAVISCDIEGDTQGVSFEMMVELDKKDHRLTYGCYIEPGDLKNK